MRAIADLRLPIANLFGVDGVVLDGGRAGGFLDDERFFVKVFDLVITCGDVGFAGVEGVAPGGELVFV